MIAIACPWCESEAPVEPALLEEAGTYTCEGCLTVVRLVETWELPLELAA